MTCANKIITKKRVAVSVALILLASCSSTPSTNEDPLKYSKKLITEGHNSLYDNGAFEVPYTQIKIIPAGETPVVIAKEMMGIRARQAFLTSLKNAADSVYIIPEGTKLSLDYAKQISQGSSAIGEGVTDITRSSGTYLIKRSANLGKDMVVDSWKFGKETAVAMNQFGIHLADSAVESGGAMASALTDAGVTTIEKSIDKAKEISASSTSAAHKSLQKAGNLFIRGYAAVPEKFSQHKRDIAESARLENFSKGITESSEFREKYSGVFTDLFSSTTDNYVSDVSTSLKNASRTFKENVDETGFGLALLKSSRWVLQGILWDGLIEPITKLGAASLGYVSVNLAAYPVMVIVQEGKAVTTLAIEVTWNTAGATYDIVAPTASAAIASVYSLFQVTGGNLAAGVTATGGSLVGATEIVSGQVTGNTIRGVGYLSGKSVQYIGVPLAAAGVTVGTGTVGVVAGTAGAVTGSSIAITGEAASLTTKAFGNIVAGTTVVTGTTASVIAGTTVGVYELSKAVIVPAGYELGGGIVLGYGTTSQLAAHSILAVADASYLVLSLEGPRWVIYAVKGNLGNGDDLPPGTLIDLEAMQTNGEEFQYLPVSEEEMQAVIESVYKELPQVPAETSATENN